MRDNCSPQPGSRHAGGVLTLETRNLRSQIALQDIIVVVGGSLLPSEDFELDGIGNIKLKLQPPLALQGETDIVVIVRDLCEPSVKNGHGRRLGLPLFSVGFEPDDRDGLFPRP
jgi:hypothetical protein